MSRIICTAQYSSQHFSGWGTNRLTCEASQLCPVGLGLLRQVYDDAADVGLVIVSQTTGRPAAYVLASVEEHGGDLQYWMLHPAPETVRQYPRLRGTVLTVFND